MRDEGSSFHIHSFGFRDKGFRVSTCRIQGLCLGPLNPEPLSVGLPCVEFGVWGLRLRVIRESLNRTLKNLTPKP